MNNWIKNSLAIKLFFSYLIVVMISLAALMVAAQFEIPLSFSRHMGSMNSMMGGDMMGADQMAEYLGFEAAYREILIIGGGAALIAAVATSFMVSNRISTQIKKLSSASQRIAAGDFKEVVPIPEAMDDLGLLAVSFNEMAGQLEKIESSRHQFISDIAHELRTPLTSIKGIAEGLIDGVIQHDIENFEIIQLEADRMQRLVNDLLQLSKFEEQEEKLHFVEFKVDEIIHQLDISYRTQFDEKGIEFKINSDEEIIMRADKDRIYQALTNLVQNALQYTPSGGWVSLTTLNIEDQKVEFCVKDSGIGIASEDIDKLFGRFYRVDKSRARISGGSGLGLAIVKRIVDLHKGKITVSSEGEGKGSEFRMILPI